jgi:hypothetical protein
MITCKGDKFECYLEPGDPSHERPQQLKTIKRPQHLGLKTKRVKSPTGKKQLLKPKLEEEEFVKEKEEEEVQQAKKLEEKQAKKLEEKQAEILEEKPDPRQYMEC